MFVPKPRFAAPVDVGMPTPSSAFIGAKQPFVLACSVFVPLTRAYPGSSAFGNPVHT